MSNDLVNMNDLKTKVSEQIKVAIFNLLPDDKIADMVEVEINAFFEEPGSNFWAVEESRGGSMYNSNNKAVIQAKVSPFRLMVWSQLQKHLSDQLDEIFKSDEFTTRCQIGDGQVKDDIQKAAMTRQEQIALSMSSVMFDRMIGESIMMGTNETKSAIEMAVFDVLGRSGKL